VCCPAFSSWRSLTLAVGLAIGQSSRAQGSGQAQLDYLARESQAGRIGRVEVLQIPKDLNTRNPVTTADLESGWFFKFTVRRLDPPNSAELAQILKVIKTGPYSERRDFRSAVIFYSWPEEKRIGSIYLDRTGSRGAVNDAPVSFGENLLGELEKALSLSLE
jgi:hypothetical protein